jgi:hypothetical protein
MRQKDWCVINVSLHYVCIRGSCWCVEVGNKSDKESLGSWLAALICFEEVEDQFVGLFGWVKEACL